MCLLKSFEVQKYNSPQLVKPVRHLNNKIAPIKIQAKHKMDWNEWL